MTVDLEVVRYTDTQLTQMFTAGFTRRSERDKQVMLGPSEVGGCEYCVGYTMAQKSVELPNRDSWGYAAWIGTMAHYWLEQNLVLTDPVTGETVPTRREHKVEVFEIPGYGVIKGHCDMQLDDTTVDYKFPGKWSYEKLAADLAKRRFHLSRGSVEWAKYGPSLQYRYQQQLYAYGFNQAGIEINRCRIIFLPRHSNNLQDVVHWEEPYQPEMVQKALDRTTMIFDYVMDGQLGEFESDPDCYRCDVYGRGDLTNYHNLFN
jgi:hypothetical protein